MPDYMRAGIAVACFAIAAVGLLALGALLFGIYVLLA
ncbi:MAG: hypothetical protein GAK28_04082 [Luteibacter sp.]|nr:MAG: hypothetical protein GAK28_04082 [Luteibacter sp.]